MIRRGLLVLTGLAILAGSLMPPGDAPGLLPDKLMHMLAYGGWAAIAVFSAPRRRRGLMYLGIIFLTGVMVEIVQPWVGREGSLADIAANTAGILAGALLARAGKTLIAAYTV